MMILMESDLGNSYRILIADSSPIDEIIDEKIYKTKLLPIRWIDDGSIGRFTVQLTRS
jgi:hypothetical protein